MRLDPAVYLNSTLPFGNIASKKHGSHYKINRINFFCCKNMFTQNEPYENKQENNSFYVINLRCGLLSMLPTRFA